MVSESFFPFSVMRERKENRFCKRKGVEKQETQLRSSPSPHINLHLTEQKGISSARQP
jgi:hypothetical protein